MSDDYFDLQMKPKEPIPKFNSYEEEAEFWDTHDVTDYWDDFAPTQMSSKGDLIEGLFVRLDVLVVMLAAWFMVESVGSCRCDDLNARRSCYC